MQRAFETLPKFSKKIQTKSTDAVISSLVLSARAQVDGPRHCGERQGAAGAEQDQAGRDRGRGSRASHQARLLRVARLVQPTTATHALWIQWKAVEAK